MFLAVRFYRHERAMVSGGMGRALAILRACLPVLLLLLLLEPVFSIHWSESLKGRVILLLDSSLSMAANDDRRPDDERVRLADSLGLLPDGVRDKSFEKLAARASHDAAQFPSVISAGKLIAESRRDAPGGVRPPRSPATGTSLQDTADTGRATGTSLQDAIADFKAKHRKLLKVIENFHDDLRSFIKERNRGTIIDKPLLETADSLKQHIAAHQNIKAAIAALDRNPAKAAIAGLPASGAAIAAYDQASADALNAAAAALISAQQTSDSFLARSDDKAVREALAKVDQMKRSEILAKLLGNGDAGLMSLLDKQFHLECYKLSGREVLEMAPDKVVRDGKL
ncbi:MAG TPA: hypothetical protein VM487_11380, partial [Phycisphaerae bacterium]|nr:hypothetical protein [Phycisphaerae bacterium]